jgi:predicted RNA-binding Zn ribbon-like protein
MANAQFRYVGGDPALDLVNTVDWTPRGPENELLTDAADLVAWATGAGVVSAAAAGRLTALARARPRDAAAALDRAMSLRGTLRRLFLEVARGAPTPAALAAFDRFLPEVHRQLTLVPAPAAERRRGRAATWTWRDGDDLDAVLWPVARSAADLLVSTEAGQVRVCGGAACGWLYVDRSRNGLRRWCQMETCGTREKSRRRRSGVG